MPKPTPAAASIITRCFHRWLAGGGVKRGIVHGATDEYGIAVAEDKVHVHDFHATILHLLGLDHERLTYRYGGRDYRLTDVDGRVVRGSRLNPPGAKWRRPTGVQELNQPSAAMSFPLRHQMRRLMRLISTKTTYLEMLAPPAGEIAPPRSDLEIRRIDRPTNDFYRLLYRAVGAELCWVDRIVMPDDLLQSMLSDDRVDVFVLRVVGELAGYSELDRRVESDIELAYFGLFPAFIGQGLGRFLLDWTLYTAWSRRPQRVWVHTCDLDHPAALPTYLKAGFRIDDEKIIEQFVPREQDG